MGIPVPGLNYGGGASCQWAVTVYSRGTDMHKVSEGRGRERGTVSTLVYGPRSHGKLSCRGGTWAKTWYTGRDLFLRLPGRGKGPLLGEPYAQKLRALRSLGIAGGLVSECEVWGREWQGEWWGEACVSALHLMSHFWAPGYLGSCGEWRGVAIQPLRNVRRSWAHRL